MTLPKLDHPTFTIKVPSTSENVHFRPMTVREEKILLMAKTSEDSDLPEAIMQVLNNCIIDHVNLTELTIFDIEYLFMMLRSQSISNIVKVSYRDPEDDKVRDFEIDLAKVKLQNLPDEIKPEMLTIEGNSEYKLEMIYPKASLYINEHFKSLTDPTDIEMALIGSSIGAVWIGDSRTSVEGETPEEVNSFIESLDVKTFDQVRNFVLRMPNLYHEIKWKNEKGTERSVVLKTLSDFFTF